MADLSHHTFKDRLRSRQKSHTEMASEREAINQRLAAITQAKPAVSSIGLQSGKDQRRSSRKNVVKLARIYLNKLDFVRCVVVNLSADGARIRLEEDQEIPQFFELRFEESGIQKKAKIAWRHNNEFGLSFLKKEKKEEEDNGIHYRSSYLLD